MWHRIADFFNVEYHKKYGEGTKFDLDYGKLLIIALCIYCLLYTSPSPRDLSTSRMPSSA